jgi:hypothetical protein
MQYMPAILCFIKTTILVATLLRTSTYSGAVTINTNASKLITTLQGTVTPDTTPANPSFHSETPSFMATTDFGTSHTTRPPIQSSTTEQPTSTVTTADTIGTTTMRTTTATHQQQLPAHRIPSRLEEKLESLSCDIPPLPTESRLWRGNETHELMLPITVSKPQRDYLFICSRL